MNRNERLVKKLREQKRRSLFFQCAQTELKVESVSRRAAAIDEGRFGLCAVKNVPENFQEEGVKDGK